MKTKKSKAKAVRKRAVKDLPPKKGANAKGGKATFHDLSFVHLVDKASPVLMQ